MQNWKYLMQEVHFNMSAGTLTIVKGGGTTFGDLYLRPESGSVTGGDIFFAHNISGSNQQYLLDATIATE